jgi:hypothetical protein
VYGRTTGVYGRNTDSVREVYGLHSHQPKSVWGQYRSVREDFRGDTPIIFSTGTTVITTTLVLSRSKQMSLIMVTPCQISAQWYTLSNFSPM